MTDDGGDGAEGLGQVTKMDDADGLAFGQGLEIDASPNREFSEGRDGERRQRHVRVEALSARLVHGQAHPIDGNAIALVQRGQAGILGIDSQTVVAANIGLIDDLSYASDNAGEHAY